MAHEVENMMYMGETPWHGLGRRVIDAPTSEEAIRIAGLDWKVDRVPLITAEGAPVDHKALVRATDKKVLGVVGPRYQPLQNSEAFAFFDPFIKAGEANYETAGSLREGKRVWILAKINRKPIEVVKNDLVEKFLLLSNSHDGTLAVRVGFSPIRVVCANTLRLAHGDQGSELIRIRHTAKMVKTLDEIREIVNLADARFEATAEQYKALAAKDCNKSDLAKYVHQVFEFSEEPATERIKENQEEVLGNIIKLFESGKGAEYHRGSYWGAYNAVTEYLGYEKGRSQDSRLDSLWFGESARVNQKAFELALKEAA